jgi:Tfp pilus assembly protein PilF
MNGHSIRRGFVTACAAVAWLGMAAPALAQNGSLQGKVTQGDGRPAVAATVTFEQVNGTRKVNTLTDKDGIWIRTGLPVGEWNITVTKDKLSGKAPNITVVAGKTTDAPEIIIDETGGRVVNRNAPVVSPEEAARKARENAELEKLLGEANAAVTEGRAEEAVEKLTALTAKIDKCDKCFINLGSVYVKLNKMEEAEKAFLKAIEFNPSAPEPYNALVNVYNTMGKLDEASKMGKKAADLMSTGGVTDPVAQYNIGVILWNQYSTTGDASKAVEAAAAFDKCIQLDPKYSEAYYLAGLAYVNQGKNTEAKARLSEYLKLAPQGKNAPTAKALLDSIK